MAYPSSGCFYASLDYINPKQEDNPDHGQRSSITHRFLVPLFLALTFMIVSRTVYLNACRVDSQALYHALALLAGAVQFASIMLVALVVYPVTYFRGAPAPERVIAGSTNPAVRVVIDTYKVSGAFPWEASLYYGVNIGAILFAWNFAQMGVLELVCRWGKRGRGNPDTIVTLVPFVPILLFLLVVCFLSKEGGATYFNMLLDGYLVLFRN